MTPTEFEFFKEAAIAKIDAMLRDISESDAVKKAVLEAKQKNEDAEKSKKTEKETNKKEN